MSSSSVKFTVIKTLDSSTLLPLALGCFPPPWNVDNKIFFKVLEWAGSSQYTRSVLLTSFKDRLSPEDWDKNFSPFRQKWRWLTSVHFSRIEKSRPALALFL